MKIIRGIQNRIYKLHGERVMFDKDVASLFGVDVIILHLTFKRYSKQFSEKLMFQLTEEEWEDIWFQIETIETSDSLKPQKLTVKHSTEQQTKFLPYVFTGQGVAMLKDILSSEKHDIQLNQFFEAMENLLDESAEKKKWNDRERIGFKAN